MKLIIYGITFSCSHHVAQHNNTSCPIFYKLTKTDWLHDVIDAWCTKMKNKRCGVIFYCTIKYAEFHVNHCLFDY